MEKFKIQPELFAEFCQSVSPYLEGIGKIEYENSQESHIVKKNRPCSVLKIYISRQSVYNQLKLDPVSGNWNNVFPHTPEIKSIWNGLLRKYKTLDEFDTKIGYVFFHCIETIEKHDIAYNSKKEIQSELQKNRLPEIQHIFCTPELYYSIVLKNEKDFKKYKAFSMSRINDIILTVLNQKSKNLGCEYEFTAQDFKCQLFHEKMTGLNLYFLSRED